jgi:hypothetical protein
MKTRERRGRRRRGGRGREPRGKKNRAPVTASPALAHSSLPRATTTKKQSTLLFFQGLLSLFDSHARIARLLFSARSASRARVASENENSKERSKEKGAPHHCRRFFLRRSSLFFPSPLSPSLLFRAFNSPPRCRPPSRTTTMRRSVSRIEGCKVAEWTKKRRDKTKEKKASRCR